MRRDIDRKGHAGPSFAACVLVDPLHPAMRSIEGNCFDRHDIRAPPPRRSKIGNGSGSGPKLVAADNTVTSLVDHAAFFDFATRVAIASIRAGDRQSNGSSPNSLRCERMPAMSSGLTPDSITEDTNAANPGAAEPASWNSSGWMKSRP